MQVPPTEGRSQSEKKMCEISPPLKSVKPINNYLLQIRTDKGVVKENKAKILQLQFGMVLHGLVRFGMVWYGLVGFGLVW